jgi:hypothetical protein
MSRNAKRGKISTKLQQFFTGDDKKWKINMKDQNATSAQQHKPTSQKTT